MQTSAEKPGVKIEDTLVPEQSRPVVQVTPGYVPFEEQSLWMRRRPWIWAAVIMFLVVIGFAAIVLPQFAISC